MNTSLVRPELQELVALGQLPASNADDAVWSPWWPALEAATELEWNAAEEVEILRIIPERPGDDYNAWIFKIIEKLKASERWPENMLQAIPEDTDIDWLGTVRWLLLGVGNV